MCVGGGGVRHFFQVSRLSLYDHTGVLGSGRSPLEAHGAGQGCVPVLPLDQCDMHFGPEPGSLPQDHPGSGVVALWLPPGQLHGVCVLVRVRACEKECVRRCVRACIDWLVGGWVGGWVGVAGCWVQVDK